MTTEPLETLRSILVGTVRMAHELKARHGFDPAPGSLADEEIRADLRAGDYRPVLEAYQMAELRLIATADHVGTLGEHLSSQESVYAVSALGRTALETSARAAWLLDSNVDANARALRGMAELLYAFREEAKYPVPPLQDLARARIATLVEAAESAGLDVVRHPRTGEPVHFGESRPAATEAIRAEMEAAGELAYRELSAIAHANPTALLRQTEAVPVEEQPEGLVTSSEAGVSLVRPAPSPASIVPKLGVVWQAYMQALEDKVALFGWDVTDFDAWKTEAGRAMARLLASPP